MVLPLFTGIFVTFSPHGLIEFWDNRLFRINVLGGTDKIPQAPTNDQIGDIGLQDFVMVAQGVLATGDIYKILDDEDDGC